VSIGNKVRSAAINWIPFARPIHNIIVETGKEKVVKDTRLWKVHISAILLLSIMGFFEPFIFILGTGVIAVVSFSNKTPLSINMGWLHMSAFLMAILFKITGVL